MASPFIPRTSFPNLPSLPRSYFLGHHKSALEQLKSAAKDTDVVLEVRDYRLPLTSINPLFESALTGASRWIIYSKVDLGRSKDFKVHSREKINDNILERWHGQNKQSAFFASLGPSQKQGASAILNQLRDVQDGVARAGTNLTGVRVIVVGMPNIGKSTLINELFAQSNKIKSSQGRRRSTAKSKVARTSMGAGTTLKFSEYIKIVDGGTQKHPDYAFPKPPVYLRDTPGVFVPYVPDSEAMLKLALAGCIKHNLIAEMMLADYLLYRLNLYDPAIYGRYCPPTNEVMEFCEAVARKHGKYSKGGISMLDWAAETVVREYQRGLLGRFVLDEVNERTLRDYDARQQKDPAMSMNQLKKLDKEMRLEQNRQKHLNV